MSPSADEPTMGELRSAGGDAAIVAQLQQAAEHLRAERLDELRASLDKLTATAPDDLRVQNLRGLYLFRVERYAEAREVYRVLVIDHPRDTALRLNLGLTELKLGDNVAAGDSLRRVTEAEPNNQRAQGYLGLALMRGGDLRGAQAAFQRAGQHELEERVAKRIVELEEEGNLQRTELERAASAGSSLLEGEQPFRSIDGEDSSTPATAAGAGRWQTRAAGERLPLPTDDPASRLPALRIHPPEAIASFANARMLRAAAGGEAFALAEGGLLVTHVGERLYTRTIGAIASSSSLTFEPVRRRVRGQSVEEGFGEDIEAMFLASGKGTMLVSPRGGHFVLLRLEDDILYVRERHIFAFEDSLGWENGRMPGANADVEPPRVVQFRGQGRVVVRSAQPLFTLKLEAETSHIVDALALAGWIGRVQPRLLRTEQGEATPYVECSGEGVLLIEEPKA
jgi:tetratricopeptide (TPR) repeat protein